jgi:putative nucleotidyltransferase with HDIG domain
MNHNKFIARVLVVDDEPSILELLDAKLSLEGYDCHTASNAESALALLRREAFDVILSDLRMPGLSGLDLMKEARKIAPRAAFLLMTGEQDVRTGVEAMKMGASDYVVKPFQLASMLRSVASAIERKQLEIELEKYRQHLEEMVEKRTQQLRKALEQIERVYDETLEALSAALDLRDSATAGHSTRVTQYALKIAEVLGATDDQMQEIARAAYLHDIGKIGIPDVILLKEGILSEEEEAVMRTHVMIGYRLLSRMAFLASTAEIVRAHHERYDGTGYPSGRKGKDIPLGARIFAVADTLDAMTSDRPYRKALSFEAAREEIRKEAGRQFDPDVVDAFLSLPTTLWENIQKDSLRNHGAHSKVLVFGGGQTIPQKPHSAISDWDSPVKTRNTSR